MISQVTIQNFKRFKAPTEFVLKPEGVTFLAGGNNSGKSTLLQALAVWDFARSVIEVNKGKVALLAGTTGQRVRVSAEEFSPIAIPSLKHLWSDLKISNSAAGNGDTLRIRCTWQSTSESLVDRHLEFGFALSNARLSLRCLKSNLADRDPVPRMAYLPPFAGIAPREERMSPVARKRWMGRGLAGAVLRNLLYDFWQQHCDEWAKAKGLKGRIPKGKRAELRKSDGWEQLLNVLGDVFHTGLSVGQFDELYHTAIEVAAWEGQWIKKQFRKKAGTPQKDLMVEGSGFLQWLSVYALALNKELDVLLLDEPDAHLHPALQGHLIHKLSQLARENCKQLLLATHSTTILSETKVERISRMEDRDYLTDERGRVSLFVGLGSQYAPRLDQLKRCKRLFLHDGPSDLEILQAWAKTLGHAWPENLVCWKYTKDRAAREILFDELRAEIHNLKAISLQGRDDYPFERTTQNLTFDDLPLFDRGLGLRRRRRRNIENYLLHPAAIARAAGRPEQDVPDLLADPHGVHIPADFTKWDCVPALALINGKKIITNSARSVKEKFGINYKQIAEAMLPG